jgi:hypothetical protein
MNKVGDTSALMAGIDFTPSDPFAIEFIYRQIWCVAPHGKILGWIKWDGPEVYRRAFHVYSHGRNDGGRVWVKAFESIGVLPDECGRRDVDAVRGPAAR